MAAVQEMARLQRILFEVEREFIRSAPTLIYRVGEPELKYLLCQHVWESAGHARFLRERGRELTGFGSGDEERESSSLPSPPTCAVLSRRAKRPDTKLRPVPHPYPA